MPSIQELDLPHNPDSDSSRSPIQSTGFGYEVEQALVAPKEFPKAPVADVFGRTEARPCDIEEALNISRQALKEPEDIVPRLWSHLPKGPFYIEENPQTKRLEVKTYVPEPSSTSTKRAREALAATTDPEHSQFASTRRQAAENRAHKNARGGLRPTQGGRR